MGRRRGGRGLAEVERSGRLGRASRGCFRGARRLVREGIVRDVGWSRGKAEAYLKKSIVAAVSEVRFGGGSAGGVCVCVVVYLSWTAVMMQPLKSLPHLHGPCTVLLQLHHTLINLKWKQACNVGLLLVFMSR